MKDKRKERILKRAISYCNGEMTADEFAMLESLENDDLSDGDHRITNAEAKTILKAISQEATDSASVKATITPTSFKITMDEYNALSLYEQQKLYNAYPDIIKDLLSPRTLKTTGQITKGRFLKMPKEEQEWYYDNDPQLVRALLDGRLSYIDSEA